MTFDIMLRHLSHNMFLCSVCLFPFPFLSFRCLSVQMSVSHISALLLSFKNISRFFVGSAFVLLSLSLPLQSYSVHQTIVASDISVVLCWHFFSLLHTSIGQNSPHRIIIFWLPPLIRNPINILWTFKTCQIFTLYWYICVYTQSRNKQLCKQFCKCSNSRSIII